MKPGQLGWIDLTVPDADRVRDYYSAVVGWAPQAVPMDDYDDYAMAPPGSTDAVAGVCHAQGANARMPEGWVPYFAVADLAASLRSSEDLGGIVLDDRRDAGGFVVLRDPDGAAFAIVQADEGAE